MAIHVALNHRTVYQYDRFVRHAPHVVRLRPAPHCRTRILSYSLKVAGGEFFINWQQDPFSNWNARLVFPEPMRELAVTVDLVAEMAVYNPFDFFLEESAQRVPFVYAGALAHDLESFRRRTKVGRRLRDFLAPFEKQLAAGGSKKREGMVTVDFLVGLNQRILERVKYLIRLEPGVQTPEETLERGCGSCRDSAWLMCEVLRQLGFASRFVSGYLIQLKADERAVDGPSGAAEDFTDLHAWCEVYLPGAGWIGLDPTSGLLAGEGHIPLSCTPEPATAAPVEGAVDACESRMQHAMEVHRVFETPRVSRPYSEEQWAKILELGSRVDRALEADDVRLTMGGEPTFVAVGDPDGAEWNFTANSLAKREIAGRLLKRLRERFAPGAFLHYGQGKWYPGEPLPRWSLNAFWRKDGVPVWEDMRWIADESRDYGHGVKEAKAFMAALCARLGVEKAHVHAAHEDVFHYLWREKRLPSNVSGDDPRLRSAEERERLAQVFQRGVGAVVGYVLPLRCRLGQWESGPWHLRDDGTVWLVPGDSPLGLRLPLDSLPWVDDPDFPSIVPSDPTQPFPSLPRRRESGGGSAVHAKAAAPSGGGRRARVVQRKAVSSPAKKLARGQSAAWVIRTALCVEPRRGRLHVFIPPLVRAEDYLDLVAAIEETAAELKLPVLLEGETPPRDPRLLKFSVTPDPGVVEVNLHPSGSWEELVDRLETLYAEAKTVGLGTEKFMLDGRQVGTGGGNHLILGGETPLDSPVLRRPDLLRSLVTYWQNHPSMSWLFSGMFIGPTSQAPRVDEARHDSLYELEVAFSQLPEAGTPVAPWLVDRLFRNLLVDATGNTHRAEFCIDKLYAPETSTGRLGLLELRAFEMAPHARMNLAQQLVIRALVAHFWRRPYTQRLVSWGTALHDRWMLPYFCEADFEEVLRDLRGEGFDFDPEWFSPHLEYRFPKLGAFVQREIAVELRAALEPWHVLGEEPAGGATVRNVDSSLERMQVLVRGMVEGRYAVLCNGRRVPLHSTGVPGEFVGAVRYRAWQPPSCLHPTIGPHAPLLFDLWDEWNQRSLGGCTYHVAHAGGRTFDTRPVNASEAESRRLARFEARGFSARSSPPPRERLNPAFPYTLDLRLPAGW
ncbi:MAG: hypothetical protein RLZZ142_2530 [Verrucomicrobiota bacterium]